MSFVELQNWRDTLKQMKKNRAKAEKHLRKLQKKFLMMETTIMLVEEKIKELEKNE